MCVILRNPLGGGIYNQINHILPEEKINKKGNQPLHFKLFYDLLYYISFEFSYLRDESTPPVSLPKHTGKKCIFVSGSRK